MPWANRVTRRVPNIGAPTRTVEYNDYSKGMNTYIANDVLSDKYLRLAQDARIVTLGEYETRRGFDFHSDAAGETEDDTITSTTGAADKSFSDTTRLAQVFTAGANGRLSKVEVNLKNDASAQGTVLVAIYTDDSGEPGTLLSVSSIANAGITSSYGYITARFPDMPSITSASDYWIVCYVQADASGSYKWSSTTDETTALVSADSGGTWSATSYALNFKQHYSTAGTIKGLHRAYKSDGTAVTLIAHGTSLYSVNNSTGALTAIKTGLDASATHYRFVTVNDVVYYVNGFDGLRKWNFTTESQITATDYTHITEHKGLLFLVDAADPNKVVYSNFADYETFTSTDFIYVPSPKTGDPTTAMLSLNGYLLIWTRNNKFILSGDDNATFRLDEAPDQKGTFTQETVTADKNFAYYLSDDGVYRTNGNEAQLLSENIYDDILTMGNKDVACIVVNKGRLYLWNTSAGSSVNDQCWVWNLNLSGDNDVVESTDTDAYVARATTAFNDDDALLVGSSLVGQAHWQELASNDYNNLGAPLDWDIRTHYHHFNAPAAEKQVRRWIFRVGAQTDSYDIQSQFAYDLRENWQTAATLGVQGSGFTWGDAGTVWGAFTWGSNSEWQFSRYIPGAYRRIAVGYKHYAARQPQKFFGHTFVTVVRRLR